MKFTIITGAELLEGITGGIGLVIFTLIFYKLLLNKNKNIGSVLIIGFSFWLTWYFRKISINLYNFLKTKYHFRIPDSTVNI